MLKKFTGARLAVATETPCCGYAIYLQRKMLIEGMEHAQKSLSTSSPVLKSFHRYKAIEKLQAVALQDIYRKGRMHALRILRFLSDE